VRAVGSSAEAAEEAHRHVLDQENEVVALVQHAQPVMRLLFRHPAQALLSECVGPATNGPGGVAHLVAGHADRVAAGMGQQSGADPQPVLAQGGMDVPGQAAGSVGDRHKAV
jgi:hypothetical protein